MEEIKEEIVIIGAGISGLATALALHRLGIKCMVLEASDRLRAAGVAFTTWTNAWKALDALGVAHSLRQQHQLLLGIVTSSTVSGEVNSYVPSTTKARHGEHEVRCVQRKVLLEALAKELPSDTIRFSSKLVSIQEEGSSKLLHLADGSILKAKVLIGCDGVNSVVGRWLGFKKPPLIGRSAIRGCARFEEANHGLPPKFQLLMGNGVKYGIIPCDDTTVYWFFTWSPSSQAEKVLQDADQVKLKQFVLSKLGNVPDHIKSVIESTQVEEIICSPLGCRPPWEILRGNISKDVVCVAGDAFHPMTPDLGEGGCSALEDGIVLAKCLEGALSNRSNEQMSNEEKQRRIKNGLVEYANKRRWRAVDLITTGYVMGFIQESKWLGMRFLREKLISSFLSGFFLSKADVDPTELVI